MFIILPALILVEGFNMLKKTLSKHNLWWSIPYALLVILTALLIVLLLMGYR
jgi:hypothetical protein